MTASPDTTSPVADAARAEPLSPSARRWRRGGKLLAAAALLPVIYYVAYYATYILLVD